MSHVVKQLILVCLCFLSLANNGLFAQNTTFNGWFFLDHQQALSKKWSLLADVQLRSAPALSDLETVLLRPSVQYQFSKTGSTALGYAYLGNRDEEAGRKTFEIEHRLWQQYLLERKAGKMEISHRLRLEQRFLESDGEFDFAQRLRYYIRTQIPLLKAAEFAKGAFVAFQNEMFLNVQNNENVNGKFFDQNRVYGAVGYRAGKALDVEVGYLYRYQIEEEKMHNHILQVRLATKF